MRNVIKQSISEQYLFSLSDPRVTGMFMVFFFLVISQSKFIVNNIYFEGLTRRYSTLTYFILLNHKWIINILKYKRYARILCSRLRLEKYYL